MLFFKNFCISASSCLVVRTSFFCKLADPQINLISKSQLYQGGTPDDIWAYHCDTTEWCASNMSRELTHSIVLIIHQLPRSKQWFLPQSGISHANWHQVSCKVFLYQICTSSQSFITSALGALLLTYCSFSTSGRTNLFLTLCWLLYLLTYASALALLPRSNYAHTRKSNSAITVLKVCFGCAINVPKAFNIQL